MCLLLKLQMSNLLGIHRDSLILSQNSHMGPWEIFLRIHCNCGKYVGVVGNIRFHYNLITTGFLKVCINITHQIVRAKDTVHPFLPLNGAPNKFN
jgi:hypothetical protein